MISLDNKTLLVVAPHADDEVIGCGGLINHVKARGGRVYVLFMTVGSTHDFTNGGQESSAHERTDEIEAVAKQLHLDGWRIAFAGDEHHLRLDAIPQREIIHEIERGEDISLEVTRPDIIALPLVSDYNQDHRAAAHAALAACRPAPATDKHVPTLVLAYESPARAWSPQPLQPEPNFFISLSAAALEKKLNAMRAYSSQLRGPAHPRHLDTLAALARLRGSLIGAAAAEAYYCYKLVAA